MSLGVDYAFGRPDIFALKAAGVKFVCRYVSTPGNPKNLTFGEQLQLRAAGIDIVTVFETVSGRALQGMTAGFYDANSAVQQLQEIGAPPRTPIYFAVDFDAVGSQYTIVKRYINGAIEAIGSDRVGVYGGYWVVKEVLDSTRCKYAWQTYAWSAGKWDPRAQIQQYQNSVKIGGVEVDLNRSMATDFGQWPTDPPKPVKKKLPPLPGPAHKPSWFWAALKEFLRRRKSGSTSM